MQQNNPFSVQKWSESYDELTKEIQSLEQISALKLIVGLQLDPKFAANAVRIEALIQLVLHFSKGSLPANSAHIEKFLNFEMGASLLAAWEDPSEDVFVSNVVSELGNTRVFEGLWESNDFITQLCVQAAHFTAREVKSRKLALYPIPLMILSEALAERAELNRFTISKSLPKGHIKLPEEKTLLRLSEYCCFTWSQLNSMSLQKSHLEEYFFSAGDLEKDLNKSFDNSSAHERPIFVTNDGIMVLIPSSLMRALRVSITRKVISLDLKNVFHDNLVDQKREKVREAFKRMGASRIDFTDVEMKVPELTSCSVDTAWFGFDGAWYILAVILMPKLQDLEISTESKAIEIAESDMSLLADWEQNVKKNVSRIPGFRGGMAFHIASSLGSGLVAGFSTDASAAAWNDWNLSLADLTTLSRHEDIDLIKLNILASIRNQFEEQNVQWVSGNGDFNFISWALDTRFQLIPRECPPENLNIGIPLNAILDFRNHVRSGLDEHGVQLLYAIEVGSKSHLIPVVVSVERCNPWSYFEDNVASPSYFILADVLESRLRCVFEVHDCAIWLNIDPPSHQESRVGMFHLWQAVVMWFEKLIARFLLEMSPLRLPKLLSINFVLEEPFVFVDNQHLDMPDLIVKAFDRQQITFVVSKQILSRFKSATNIAEKLLITTILESLLQAYGDVAYKHQLRGLIDQEFEKTGARSMHVAFRTDVRAMIHSFVDRGRPARASPEVSAASRIGLAKRVCANIRPQKFRSSQAKGLLKASAKVLREQIKQRLESLNRAHLIEAILCNIEAIEADEWQWRLSSQALLDLHGGIDKVNTAIQSHISSNKGALLASKIVIEMAICDSPVETGLVATDYDIRWLLGQALVLIEVGYCSDAVYCGFAKDDAVIVHHNGEIECEFGFHREIVVPFQSRILRQSIEGAALSYNDMIGIKEEASPASKKEAFHAVFRHEVGVEIEDGYKIVHALGLIALHKQCIVLNAPQVELVEQAATLADLPEKSVVLFFDYFSLSPRVDYNVPPSNYSTKDIHPWRFNRQLSVVRRPFLIWLHKDIRRMVVSPSVAEHSFMHFVTKFYQGEYEQSFFISEAARSWVKEATRRESEAFEDAVAAAFIAAGFIVEKRVNMTRLSGEKKLGEIDVLACSKSGDLVWIIECKNFRDARTVKEIAEQLNKCSGKDGDHVYKHLRRFNWIKDRPEVLSKVLSVESTFVVHERIVTNGSVPMRFRAQASYPQDHWLSFNELPDYLSSVLGGKDARVASGN